MVLYVVLYGAVQMKYPWLNVMRKILSWTLFVGIECDNEMQFH